MNLPDLARKLGVIVAPRADSETEARAGDAARERAGTAAPRAVATGSAGAASAEPSGVGDTEEALLAQLNTWRLALVEAFHQQLAQLTGSKLSGSRSADARLTSAQLTDCARRTIDRLVFMRFLEDKRIEPKPLIRDFGSASGSGMHWRDFIRTCKRLDARYDGAVFKHHDVLDAPDFEAGPVFARLCDEISAEHTPYRFDAIPVEILGRIYERFLGKTVEVNGDRITVANKPGVRKNGGVYYTPDYIVAYMVDRALGPLVTGKTADDILRLRIIDTACGAGSFLIGAYSYLLNAILGYWRNNRSHAKKGLLEEREGKLRLTLQYRRKILLSCLYGVDIDPQAVEVAQLSLCLKLLEDEAAPARLPSLASNIAVGDATLLDFAATFPNAFKRGGFDVVIGNPPYIKEYTNDAAFAHVRGLPCFQGKMDLWYLFASIGLDLLRPKSGTLAYIATQNWITNAGASKLREKIARDARIEQLIDFGNFKVFRDAGIQTMILIARRDDTPETYAFDLRRLSGQAPSAQSAHALLARAKAPDCDYLTPTFDRAARLDAPFTFSNDAREALLNKLQTRADTTLGNIVDIAQGIVPNPDVVTKASLELIPARRRERHKIAPGTGVFVVPNGTFPRPNAAEKLFLKPCYDPADVDRYRIAYPSSRQLLYSTRENTANRELPKRLRDHLHSFREIMAERRENKSGARDYFHLHWPREERFFRKGPKILAARKCAEPTFAYTEDEAYVMMAFNVILSTRVNLLYLTALLNSRVVKFWLRHRGKRQGENYQLDGAPLLAIPVRLPSAAEQNAIGLLVKKILNRGQSTQLDEKIQSRIEKLHDLTETESTLLRED